MGPDKLVLPQYNGNVLKFYSVAVIRALRLLRIGLQLDQNYLQTIQSAGETLDKVILREGVGNIFGYVGCTELPEIQTEALRIVAAVSEQKSNLVQILLSEMGDEVRVVGTCFNYSSVAFNTIFFYQQKQTRGQKVDYD
eukprot:TRINITY_DN43170_c0_g1_i1.p1 TRINITY_DN43170_c0_g1~~TRINITY_DN43170_c0_g1_i1.p1  ORF type:complete len:139 (+),score=19.96 TRINITY_DN43170_c0_g1_i1:3-419(+)